MIELKNLTKHYGETKALDDVTCSIKKGEIIGFVGPNGAGKTTAMKIITTYVAPTSGSATVGGYDVLKQPNEVRKMIGYLPETVPLYYDMLVSEYLEFIGEARHLNGNLKERMDWVVDACGLEPVFKRKISVLSKGFKQRTCLAQALIHDPEILILDEPTSGLDPLQIVGIRKLIRDLAHEKTIILSTHILPEVATISDKIMVINGGRLVADGTFEELRAQVTEKSSVFLSVKTSKKDFENTLEKVSSIDEVAFIDTEKRGVVQAHLFFKPGKDITSDLNATIRESGWDIVEFHQEKLSLEDSFILLTKGNDAERTQQANDEGGAE
ncbi:MAG: ATP-binding cassette domain-containing protein [candidate division KSB1 bacterium]|nr:ATP-binding cassette domain-containing protein [candidate division KSB1 bacterium]